MIIVVIIIALLVLWIELDYKKYIITINNYVINLLNINLIILNYHINNNSSNNKINIFNLDNKIIKICKLMIIININRYNK